MLRIICCSYCKRYWQDCICQMLAIQNKIMIGDEYLLEIQDDMIRLFKFEQINGRFHYHTSREIIDYEVQWLKIDDVIVPMEIQEHVSSVVRNAAFL